MIKFKLAKFEQKILVWLGWILWHINHCRLFNAKPFFFTYILNIYDLVWLDFMAYQPL